MKLLGALAEFRPANWRPFTVRLHQHQYTLTDGHHRAFLAYLHGIRRVNVRYDTDAGYDWSVWEKSTDECRRRGISSLSDLVGHLVSHEEYQERWIGFCESLE